MKKHRIKLALGLLIVLLIVFSWYEVKPVYTKKVYHLQQCTGISLTVIEYSTCKDRGVAFVYGEYKGDAIPDKDVIVQRGLTGLDASFNAIVTCHSDSIIVNYEEGYFDRSYPPARIIGRRLYYEHYDSLRRNSIGQTIKVY